MVFLFFNSACAVSQMNVDHTISLDNVGLEDVYDFQVIYGDFSFPKRPDDCFVSRGGKQYSIGVVVPKTATVVWTTADKKQHHETVDILRHVEDKPWFDGRGKVVFEVDGSALRVFLVRKLKNFEEDKSLIFVNYAR